MCVCVGGGGGGGAFLHRCFVMFLAFLANKAKALPYIKDIFLQTELEGGILQTNTFRVLLKQQEFSNWNK